MDAATYLEQGYSRWWSNPVLHDEFALGHVHTLFNNAVNKALANRGGAAQNAILELCSGLLFDSFHTNIESAKTQVESWIEWEEIDWHRVMLDGQWFLTAYDLPNHRWRLWIDYDIVSPFNNKVVPASLDWIWEYREYWETPTHFYALPNSYRYCDVTFHFPSVLAIHIVQKLPNKLLFHANYEIEPPTPMFQDERNAHFTNEFLDILDQHLNNESDRINSSSHIENFADTDNGDIFRQFGEGVWHNFNWELRQ